MINEIISFFNGDYKVVTQKIEEEMYRESSLMHYEKAKELKDLLDSINITVAKQKVEINDKRNIDVFGYYESKGYLAIQVFFIRSGTLFERHQKIIEGIDKLENIIEYIINQYNIESNIDLDVIESNKQIYKYQINMKLK